MSERAPDLSALFLHVFEALYGEQVVDSWVHTHLVHHSDSCLLRSARVESHSSGLCSQFRQCTLKSVVHFAVELVGDCLKTHAEFTDIFVCP